MTILVVGAPTVTGTSSSREIMFVTAASTSRLRNGAENL
jgi:hypothetical protein